MSKALYTALILTVAAECVLMLRYGLGYLWSILLITLGFPGILALLSIGLGTQQATWLSLGALWLVASGAWLFHYRGFEPNPFTLFVLIATIQSATFFASQFLARAFGMRSICSQRREP